MLEAVGQTLGRIDPAWAQGILVLIGLGIAWRTIREQTRNSRLEKVADVLMECTRRFGDLIALRRQLEADVKREEIEQGEAAARYFHAYWNLKWDQYNFFLLGLLPKQVLATWFLDRIRTLQRGEIVLGISFRDGWVVLGRDILGNYTDFVAFVDAVWDIADGNVDNAKARIEALLDAEFKKGKSMRVDFSRKSISRN